MRITGVAILVAGQSVLAVTNLTLVGGKSLYPGNSFGNQPPTWLPYLFPAIFILAGIIHFLFPRLVWWLKMFGKNWEFDEPAEPSSLWLFFARLGGLVMIGFGVFLFTVEKGGLPHFAR